MDRRRALIGLVLGTAVACSGPPVVPPTATPVTTPSPSATESFSLPPSKGPPTNAPAGELDLAALRHDSRDTLYRAPGGAVPAGTPVMLRFRTLHDDATAVTARVYSLNAGDSEELPMEVVADNVSCYDHDLDAQTCDFWQVTLPNNEPDNLWYRFVIEDREGAKAFYADDSPALDGGLGAPSGSLLDQSWALTVYDPDFATPEWTTNGVVYQIFPDRFRNGDPSNDPQTADPRYDDPVIAKTWTEKPEGYCRGYTDGNCGERPRGRDYFGGDLAGITQELDYLADLGINTIYLNPVFDAGSNHSYDTQDYTRIDPYFGTQADWDDLVEQANARGIRVVLDGVFNHLSSDSPFFDRYGHYDSNGACEAEESEFRDWFYFRPALGGGCNGPDGDNTVGYAGWAGVDSIPVIHKDLEQVLEYFLTGEDSIARRWLDDGASGWRLDVSGDPTFPDDWWSTFREVVKGVNSEALIVAEQWQKDTDLLRQLRGDRFDSTMNYRFRDAVLGFLAPGLFDRKGFPASGAPTDPADFANRMLSIQEDYPPEVYRSLFNLLDSHDTERILWTLTPGEDTANEKEFNPANVEEGFRRTQLASLIQLTMPGMPTIYYGDEVGLTGDDDPDDRRPYPWDLIGPNELQMKDHYSQLLRLRSLSPSLNRGDLRFLLVGSDDEGTIAYWRQADNEGALVAINQGLVPQTISIPMAGVVPDGSVFDMVHAVGPVSEQLLVVRDGALTLDLPALGGQLLRIRADLTPPGAPKNLSYQDLGSGSFALTHDPSDGEVQYRIYASPLAGGGFLRVKKTGRLPAGTRYLAMTALDEAGNESGYSNEVEIPVVN